MQPVKKIVKIDEIKSNPNNPRTINKQALDELIESIKQFPEMLTARPLVINKQGVVIGGNQRLEAIKALKMKQVEVIQVDWTQERQDEFMVKDNLNKGEWDYEKLLSQWDTNNIEKWGVPSISWKPRTNPDSTFSGLTDEIYGDAEDRLNNHFSDLAGEKMNKQEIICKACSQKYFTD